MTSAAERAAVLRRALDYPYEVPNRSFLYRDGRALELPAEGPDLSRRSALLAYGANAAPRALAAKLAALPGREMPVILAELEDLDVVFSAHISPYGAVPATLQRSPGTVAPVFVAYPDSEQLQLLAATEPNYELRRLERIHCRPEGGATLTEAEAFCSRHGCLSLDGEEVAVAAVRAAGRRFRSLDEPEVLETVRRLLAPASSIEEFVLQSLLGEVAAARTALLRASAKRPAFDRAAPGW